MKAFPPAVILSLLLVASLSIAGCASVTDPKTIEMEAAAGVLADTIDTSLNELRSGLRNNSLTLARSGLSGPAASEVLAENLRNYPWAISSLAISRDGIVLSSAPVNAAVFPGTDLSAEPSVQRANAERVPIVSEVFRLKEGYGGISQSYPIVSSSGEYLGYTDISYTPEAFLGRHIERVTRGTSYDAWVTQADGTIIFDTHEEEIGKNLFTDPAYADPGLQQVFTRIAKEPSGTVSYVYWDRDWSRNVTKTAAWDTAGINGAKWRVVITDAGSTRDVKTTRPAATAQDTASARYASLTRFVNGAATYAKEHGKEAALKEFNNRNGSFIEGEMYVFAYGMDGTVIALPYQQGLLGTDRTGIADPNGVKFIGRMTEIAREGGGSLYYIYQNPERNYQEEFKLSYVVPVDSEWFVGSGTYLPGLPARFNTTERDELVQRVRQAQDYALANGATKSIAGFNDRSGAFADGNRYIFAYAFNGTTLALPFQPDVIGSNRMNYTDMYGVKITAWEISVARRGGGFVYVDYLNPDTGSAGLKLCYVAPVDDRWFVGSGIYYERG